MEIQKHQNQEVSIQTILKTESLQSWSPQVISKAVKVRNTSQALSLISEHGIKSFSKLNDNFIESLLIIWIVNLNEFIYGNDTSKALTEQQIEQTADVLIDMPELRNITIVDLNLIFKKAYAGEYGKLYGRLRPDNIIEWFVNYFNDRCEAAADLNIKKHSANKSLLANVPRQAHGEIEMREGMKKAVGYTLPSAELLEASNKLNK